jgi:hypothetical protein
MPSVLNHDLHDAVEKDGFVVIRNFLSPEEVKYYLAASETAVQLSRDGKWPHVRTRGKQFPPWPKNFSPDIWGVSGLLHPDLAELDPSLGVTFQKLYAHDRLLDSSSDILQTPRDNLVMELLNMLINPLTDFELEWHRDDIRPEVTAEEELAALKLKDTGTQFNLALCEDSCLVVVPATHKRARTEEEREVTLAPGRNGKIPGQLVVELKPGDCVFYNNNILHRGVYNSKVKRVTLHGSYGHGTNGKSRSQNVLQHGVSEWLPRFKPTDPKLIQLKAGLDKLVNENEGKDIGYSLDG